MTRDEVELCEPSVAPLQLAVPSYPRPDYSREFKCLAQACDENCCNGWSIPIDQHTLETYLHHPILKPFAETLVVLNINSPSVGDAARMPLTHQGTCGFLSEEKLCGIHAHFGPSMLSTACATYPREHAYQSGRTEAALDLSCPEAARLTLLDPSLLGSGPWHTAGPERYTHIPHATRLPASFDPVLALRELTLLILSDPTYPLWQRLYLLSHLAQRLESLSSGNTPRRWSQENPSALAALIDETIEAVAFHTILLPIVSADPVMQLRFTAEILRVRLSESPVSEPFLATVHAFQGGLDSQPGHLAQLNDTQIGENFSSAYREFALPILSEHPHLIENFLANHIFKYAYPFGRVSGGASPTDQHLTLVAHLALTQTMIVGLAAHHRERFTPGHIVRLIQHLSKAIEHRPASVAHLARLMEVQGFTTPDAQAQLLYLA